MKSLNGFVKQIFGLFVDDGSLAIAIVAVVAAAGWVSIRFTGASAVIGAILFVGCLTALVENIMRMMRTQTSKREPNAKAK